MQNILVTDGGPHSAENWAEATSSHIVSIANTVSGAKRGAAIKLQGLVVDILEKAHLTVQTGERTKIAQIGPARLTHELVVAEHISFEDTIAQIVAAAIGSPWQDDFSKPEFAENLRVLLNSHFATNMHIERSYHADRNPDNDASKQFRATYHPGDIVTDPSTPSAGV